MFKVIISLLVLFDEFFLTLQDKRVAKNIFFFFSFLRCGRSLNTGGQQHMWRWTGFNMGLDLIVTFDDWHLSIKRSLNSTGSNEHEAVLSNHKKRHIYYRVSVVSLNSQKQVSYQVCIT